jgi:hypothetical protein
MKTSTAGKKLKDYHVQWNTGAKSFVTAKGAENFFKKIHPENHPVILTTKGEKLK